MRPFRNIGRIFPSWWIWLLPLGIGLAWLLLNRLASLTGGMSLSEIHIAVTPVGWHGIFHQPLDLPLKLVQSPLFWASPDHGAILTRLPSALFGALAVLSFGSLIWQWHGRRTSLLATLLFATGAWTLHVSRLASFDVLYLWAMPTLLLTHLGLKSKHYAIWLGSLLTWGLLLYIPGMVWLLLVSLYIQRPGLRKGWSQFNSWWQRSMNILAIFIWLPLLVLDLSRSGQLAVWLGLPSQWPSLTHLVKQFLAVPVHLFIRGPQYPELWLGRAPILDIFTLALCAIGIYFYVTRWQSRRSRLLAALFVTGAILVGFGGAVSIGLLVSLLYVVSATGIAYLLRDWLKVFPRNPIARGLGIGLVALAVAVSCTYNLRAYFVAWPHNAATKATFRYHRP